MHPLKIFSTPLSGAPQKCFQSGPALANTGPEYVGHTSNGIVAQVANERVDYNNLGTHHKFKQYETQKMKNKSILFRKPLLKAQNDKICLGPPGYAYG